MIREDDRTPEQHKTHTLIVLGTDRFLSGWGMAAHGKSYAGWACKPSEVYQCEKWVSDRGDMQRVRIVGNDYRPSPHCVHLHIYVWNGGPDEA